MVRFASDEKCPFCAEDIQDAAIVCKHCGRDLPATARSEVPSPPEPTQTAARHQKPQFSKGFGRLITLLIGGGVILLAWILTYSTYSEESGVKRGLTEDQRSEIIGALHQKELPTPLSLEINDNGHLVATFQVSEGRSLSAIRESATTAVLTIRNTLYPNSPVNYYRVTFNGPPPGPGLVLRYGSARFSEGGAVEWEPGVRR